MKEEKVFMEDLQGEYSSLMCCEGGKKLFVVTVIEDGGYSTLFRVFDFSKKEDFQNFAQALRHYNSL